MVISVGVRQDVYDATMRAASRERARGRAGSGWPERANAGLGRLGPPVGTGTPGAAREGLTGLASGLNW